MKHGTQYAYRVKSCRCQYCTAAQRVAQRGSSPALQAAIRDAALNGTELPAEALPLRKSAQAARETQAKAAREEANGVNVQVVSARMIAALKAEGDPARLAMQVVAEWTKDPVRAMRYERVAQALAGPATPSVEVAP